MTRTTISQSRSGQADPRDRGSRAARGGGGRRELRAGAGRSSCPLDFRLLQALAHCAIEERERGQEADDQDVRIPRVYLADEINLGKAAELLDLSRFELQARFLRLGAPLRLPLPKHVAGSS